VGNVRHLHSDGSDDHTPHGDQGGYSYSAFGKLLRGSDPGALNGGVPLFGWQGKRVLSTQQPNLYDSRARVWSADLGAFLQPDEYVFLTPTGTLWSWPGQNPFRYRDPSGRYAGPLPGAAAAAAAEGGAAAVGAGLLAAGIVGYAAWDIYHQIYNWKHPIISHADPDKPGAGGKDPCPTAADSGGGPKADSSGGGAKGPPAAAGDVGADAPDPNEGLGKSIANGHAFDKHVVERGEFQDLGINSRDEFANHIDNVVSNAADSDVRSLTGGRSAYWDDSSGTVVIRDPASPDLGTAFRPVSGRLYFEGLR
jgi:hypothetical protein